MDFLDNYLLLALRLDKAFRRHEPHPFVDYYYGPPELRMQAESEPEWSPADLARFAGQLLEVLPNQDYENPRLHFLEVHLRAMELVAQLLGGEQFPLEEELQRGLDLKSGWIPDEYFARSLRLLDEALPGPGNLRQRFNSLLERTRLPAEKSELVQPIMERILAEARRRTQSFVALPPGESLEIGTIRDVSYGAANWYLGGYRSRLELNISRPVYSISLFSQMCHECYPGHHTEFCLKEQHLARQRGYTEHTAFIIGPQLVIAEGIATLAMEMIFTPQEAADWAGENLFKALGIELSDYDLPRLFAVLNTLSLDELWGNLVVLLRQGRSEEEVLEYAVEFAPLDADFLRTFIQSLRAPLSQLYAFTYAHGKRLMQPLLGGPDRLDVFRRLLTEPVYPSLLEEWAST